MSNTTIEYSWMTIKKIMLDYKVIYLSNVIIFYLKTFVKDVLIESEYDVTLLETSFCDDFDDQQLKSQSIHGLINKRTRSAAL